MIRAVATLSAVLLLASCANTKQVIIQLCLQSDADAEVLIRELQIISEKRNMIFIDNSANTMKQLDRIDSETIKESSRLLNVGINGPDGVGLTAGNLGLARHQIAVGFTGGDHGEAGAFKNFVIERLSQRWILIEVPQGKGALPSEYCNKGK